VDGDVDGKGFDFKLREGLKFHNGDPFTADDVRFSFQRAKGDRILKEKVRDVEVPAPRACASICTSRGRDLARTFDGTMVMGAGWIVPKKYFAMGEAVAANLQAIGFRTQMCTRSASRS
jgi:peptide/nickel transport system substrate-binding protein